jgi:serine/threonine-protein kinase
VADPLVGRVLDGRYLVGERIARGGMATVYEARDLRLDRACAVKVMHSDLGDDEEFVRRFVREARAAARLSHPNVVAIFDQGDDDGTLYLVMERVVGRTLRDLLRAEAPLPPARALGLLDPVLSALAAAHASGLVHRDVKPENVLIAGDGQVKVADFGLARAVSAETQHTATGGVLIGTVSYLSPELVVDGRADPRSDVYSAGVLLFEMLTGRKPHEGDSPIQVAYKHVHEDVPPPSRTVRGIPSYVDALVARATARDRDRRPADARVLQHHLHRVAAALAAGVVDDPELTADLVPAGRVPSAEHDAYPTLETERPGRTRGNPGDLSGERTSVIGTRATIPAVAAVAGLAADSAASPAANLAPPPQDDRAGRTSPPARTGREPSPAGLPGSARRRRRGWVLLVVVLVLALAAGAAGWWLGIARYTTTPSVLDMSMAGATDKLEAAGLSLDVSERDYSETVDAGDVISTDPAPGERVLDDGTVTAVVSRGPERYGVPSLAGTNLDAATAALEDTHLAVGDVTRVYHDRVAEGDVVSSDPAAGTSVKRDAVVDLVVSKGREPVEVVDVTGQQLPEARRTLRELGLAVEVERRYDDEVPAGEVISQSPDDGTLFKHDPVTLVVSRGPELVAVPSVFRMGVEAARKTLADAGFEVRVRDATPSFGLGFVVQQDPGGDERAPKGSVVTIYLV